jgi:hypothetical protein
MNTLLFFVDQHEKANSMHIFKSQSQSYITADGQSANLASYQTPI